MFKLRRLRCSFCGKYENEVLKLVAGRRGYICDSCASIANEIMTDSCSPPAKIARPQTGHRSTETKS